MFQSLQGDWVHLLAEDIVGDLTWEVLWRSPGRPWQTVGRRHERNCEEGLDDGPRSVGKFPTVTDGRRVEFLIRWQGAASVMLRFGPKPSTPMGESTNVRTTTACADHPASDDYEYNNGSPWADDIIGSCTPL